MDPDTLKSQIEAIKRDPWYLHRLQLKDDLMALGDRRRSLRKQLDANREALRQKLPAAHEAGLTVIQLARWTGMTRRAVYDVLEQQEAPAPLATAEGVTTTSEVPDEAAGPD